MASWFKRGKDDPPEILDISSADSTIEVKASVIAEAARAAQQPQQPAAQPVAVAQQVGPQPAGSQQVGPQAGIAADGLVSGSDFVAEVPAEPAPDGSPHLDQALAERRSLVQLCLYALDRARSAGVAERLEEGLAGVGVTALRPDGIRFDPAFHEAGGTVATADETLDGLVAETEVVGFTDRGDVLRAPIVTVYSKAAQ